MAQRRLLVQVALKWILLLFWQPARGLARHVQQQLERALAARLGTISHLVASAVLVINERHVMSAPFFLACAAGRYQRTNGSVATSCTGSLSCVS